MATPTVPDPDEIRRRIRSAAERRLGIDTRALATFRIVVGLALVLDLGLRSRHLVAFYTDAGVLPRSALAELYPVLSRLSIHALSGAASVQVALFALAAAVAASLTVGYRTRTAAVVSWVLLASLQVRNYAVLNGGDTALLVLLFFGLFLPLGERWSVDALRADERRARVASPATAAILAQVVLVYATNAVFKLRGEAWRSGEAVAQVLSIDRYSVLLGPFLAEYPWALAAITRLWLAMLVGSPLLILLAGRLRSGAVAAFVCAHVGMAVAMPLGLFPVAMIAGLALFLPSDAFDAVGAGDAIPARVRARIRRPCERLPAPGTIAPPSIRRAASRAATIAAAALLVVSLAWQAAAVGAVEAPADAPVDPVDHGWKLFAPDPPTTERWYVAPAELESGAEVDAYRLAPVTRDRPPDGEAYRSTRWRKYLGDVRRGGETRRRHLAAYLCERASDRYDEPVDSIALYYVERPAGADGSAATSRGELGAYDCRSVRAEREPTPNADLRLGARAF